MSNARPEMSESDVNLLQELEPVAENLLNRHLNVSKFWVPALIVPHSIGQDFPPDYEWSPEEFPLPNAVRSALFVNLLTEDNLPYYFRDIERMFGREGAWGEWVRRWTAEENRHATVIRDYLTVTRAIDPIELEHARMDQMSGGKVPEPPTAADGLIYVALQELATRISHNQTGTAIADATKNTKFEDAGKAGQDIMRRVAIDENNHHLLYRDLASAVIELDPSMAVLAMSRQIMNFEMPGTGIPGFKKRAKEIAHAGIYDTSRFYNEILKPVVVTHWQLPQLEGLSPEAEQAREGLMHRIGQFAKAANRTDAKRNAV